jgi:4-hydroxy-3-polyprenylbenzoate decarboxylase
MSGSTGSIYGIRVIQELRKTPEVEIHLIVSAPAKRTLVEETDFTVKDVEALAPVRRS